LDKITRIFAANIIRFVAGELSNTKANNGVE